MISELRAVTLVPGLEPNARNAGEKRLAAGGCLQACTGKDRVSFHTGGAPALMAPPRAAQLPAAEPSLLRPKLPRRALRRRNGSPGWPARVERRTAGTGSREPGHFLGPRGPRSLQTPGRPAIRGPSPCSGAQIGRASCRERV